MHCPCCCLTPCPCADVTFICCQVECRKQWLQLQQRAEATAAIPLQQCAKHAPMSQQHLAADEHQAHRASVQNSYGVSQRLPDKAAPVTQPAWSEHNGCVLPNARECCQAWVCTHVSAQTMSVRPGFVLMCADCRGSRATGTPAANQRAMPSSTSPRGSHRTSAALGCVSNAALPMRHARHDSLGLVAAGTLTRCTRNRPDTGVVGSSVCPAQCASTDPACHLAAVLEGTRPVHWAANCVTAVATLLLLSCAELDWLCVFECVSGPIVKRGPAPDGILQTESQQN